MPQGSPSSTTVRTSPRVAYRTVAEGGGVLLHLDTGAYHSINETGHLIWEAIGEGATVAELAGVVADRFGLPHQAALEDVASFIEGLAERALVELG
jgi:hypothetical protein